MTHSVSRWSKLKITEWRTFHSWNKIIRNYFTLLPRLNESKECFSFFVGIHIFPLTKVFTASTCPTFCLNTLYVTFLSTLNISGFLQGMNLIICWSAKYVAYLKIKKIIMIIKLFVKKIRFHFWLIKKWEKLFLFK
jgi:hypothetical protein